MKTSWLGSFSEFMEHADEIATFCILQQPRRLCAAGGCRPGVDHLYIKLGSGVPLTHPLRLFNEAPEPLAINQSLHS